MSEEIKEIFNQWKQFLSWCYENNDKTAEIHRDNLEKVMEYTKRLENQLQQKENIIKEVREYTESNLIHHCNDFFLNDIKTILDKENK